MANTAQCLGLFSIRLTTSLSLQVSDRQKTHVLMYSQAHYVCVCFIRLSSGSCCKIQFPEKWTTECLREVWTVPLGQVYLQTSYWWPERDTKHPQRHNTITRETKWPPMTRLCVCFSSLYIIFLYIACCFVVGVEVGGF